MNARRFHTRELSHQKISDPVEFTVPLDFPATFIRVLAHHQHGAVLGGTAPTVLIQAGVHEPTACPAGATTKILGSGGSVVAQASVQRENDDIYLVTIEHQAPSGPWSVAVRNDESLPQTFYCVIADKADKTRQPWLILLDDLTLDSNSRDELTIVNVGNAPLTVLEGFQAGDRFGGAQSPLTIVSLPNSIRPHRTGTVVVQCARLEPQLGGAVITGQESLPSNDPNPVSVTVRLVYPTRSPSWCRSGDGCLGFRADLMDGYDGYYCICGHPRGSHNLPDPDDGEQF